MNVNDTFVDKLVNCTLVKLTSSRRIDIAEGQISAKKLLDVYTCQSAMEKTFHSYTLIEMKEMRG